MNAGKHALITGGIRGIGLEMGKALLRTNLEKLCVTDIFENFTTIEKLRNEFPGKKIWFEQIDVTNVTQMKRVYKKVFKDFNNFDIIINNAGIFNDLAVEQTILINVGGVINSSLQSMKLMSKENGGRGGFILNVAATAGLGPTFFAPVYSSSKWAVLGFTRCMGYNDFYYNKTGVKYMAICPGCTNTNLTRTMSDRVIMKELKPVIDNEILSKYVFQDIATTGKCVLQALTSGKNGGVFVCDRNIIKEVELNELTLEFVSKEL